MQITSSMDELVVMRDLKLTILFFNGGCWVADPLSIRWTGLRHWGLFSCDPCGLSAVHVLAAHRTIILEGDGEGEKNCETGTENWTIDCQRKKLSHWWRDDYVSLSLLLVDIFLISVLMKPKSDSGKALASLLSNMFFWSRVIFNSVTLTVQMLVVA